MTEIIGNSFFVVDSCDCASFAQSWNNKSRLFGWCICDGEICTDANLGERVPNGDGCYIYVKREDETVTLTQDYIGSYGLYLYEKDGFFALSNSFQVLVDHLKEDHVVTLNKRFARYLLTTDMCSAAYSETIISEIRMLDRRAVVVIDGTSGELRIGMIDYEENSIDIASDAGIGLLDAWYGKWLALAQSIVRGSTNIIADLSGGFDSRMTMSVLLPIIEAGGYVAVNSSDDGLHTHAEDFRIAKQIANRYGIDLNNRSQLVEGSEALSMEEAIELDYSFRLGFHKQMHFETAKSVERKYYFSGAGGECIRSYWRMNEKQLINKALDRCGMYSDECRDYFSSSVLAVLENSINESRAANSKCSASVMQCFYRDTRCRHHFGKDSARNWCLNTILLSPLLDKDLQRLSLSTAKCKDENLLCAVMLSRYCPDLADFPFEGGRNIDEDTMRFAKNLNAKYPYTHPIELAVFSDKAGSLYAHSTKGDELSEEPRVNRSQIEAVLKRSIRSTEVKSIFVAEFGREPYDLVLDSVEELTWHPLSDANAAFAVCKAMIDSRAEECPKNMRFVPWILGCAEDDRCDDVQWMHPRLRRLATARVDIQSKDGCGEFSCKGLGYRTRVVRPDWMNVSGCGYTVEAIQSPLEIVICSQLEQDLNVFVRSLDVRNPDGKRLPIWLECLSLNIDGDEVLEAKQLVTHDKPFTITQRIASESKVVLRVAWRPVDVLPTDVAQEDILLREASLAGGEGLTREELKRQIYEIEHSRAYKVGSFVAKPVRLVRAILPGRKSNL